MVLKIYLLGQFKLHADDIPLDLPSRSAQSLLAFLALNQGVNIRREKAASILWPEATESNARAYLRKALWQIRKSLEDGSLAWDQYLQINNISISFKQPSDVWLDADLIRSNTDTKSIEAMVETASLYRGELLPGFYEDWIVVEREHLLMAYHQLMDQLIDRLLQEKRWDDVIQWSEEWIQLGASPEPAYRALMKAHAGLGNSSMFSLSYQRCVETLSRDLDISPSPETRKLFGQLRDANQVPKKTTSSLVAEKLPLFFTENAPCPVERPVFVTREKEFQQLDKFLDQVIDNQGKAIFVTGETGSGKTTFINEFIFRVQAQHPELIVAHGNCDAQTGIGDPYLPFREILNLLTGDIESLWSAGTITREYAQFLWNLLPVTIQALVHTAPDLLDTFISSTAVVERVERYAASNSAWVLALRQLLTDKGVNPGMGNPHQNDLFIQYSKLLQTLAKEYPVILVLDDLQWADIGSISLLFHLGKNLPGHRILVIGAYRPEDVALTRAQQRHPLEPVVNELRRLLGEIQIDLDLADRDIFVNALLDSEPNLLGPEFREKLFQLTRGHPLFTIELLRGMQERGDIVQDIKGRWIEGANLDWETFPARVEAVIEERIGRLNPVSQAILRTGSIEGEVFTAEVVACVQGRSEAEIFDLLNNDLGRKHHLVRSQSIQRLDGQMLSTYRFRHNLMQRYLYQCMDEIERVHLHEQVGNVLEDIYTRSANTESISPQLARHFLKAKNSEKALFYLQQAGERAFQVYAYQEAISHLSKGLALLETMPEPTRFSSQELSLQLTYSLAYNLAMGSFNREMEQACIRALELCEKIGNETQYCQLLNVQSIMHYVKGEYSLAIETAQTGLDLGRKAENPLLILLGLWGLGISHFALGHFTQAQSCLEEVESIYDPDQHHMDLVKLRGIDVGLSSIAYLACCQWYLGYPDTALATSRRIVELAHQLNHAFSLADVLRYGRCEIFQLTGDGDSLTSSTKEMIKLAQDKNIPAWISTGIYCLGEAKILQGQFQKGIELVLQGANEDLAIDVMCSTPSAFSYLAIAYLNTGNKPSADRAIQQAFALMERTGERRFESNFYQVLARLQLAKGEIEEAEASINKAIEVARTQKAKILELRATIELVRLWQRQRKGGEGRQRLKDLYDWFTEGFDTPELKAARALLEELVASIPEEGG